MISEVLQLILVTFAPFLELRASIPYGIIGLQMPWYSVFLICVVANILLGILVYLILDNFVHILLRNKLFHKWYHRYVEITQHKIHRAVEKYGELGVAIFIGIPLPLSGVYSGALGSYIIGLGFKKFVIANIIGVLIAGIIVTAVSVTGVEAFNFMLQKALLN